MSDDLILEIEAINSIYGPSTLAATGDSGIYTLAPPMTPVAFLLHFPSSYPQHAPEIRGTESSGTTLQKSHASICLRIARDILVKTFRPGSVCIFEFLEELQVALAQEMGGIENIGAAEPPPEATVSESADEKPDWHADYVPPEWVSSEPLTEKKSTFVGHAASVSSPTAARDAVAHLLATDKKVAKATHNILAYRIRDAENAAVLYQDCDDDGESAAGSRLLKLLQNMDVYYLVVVSRWYGECFHRKFP